MKQSVRSVPALLQLMLMLVFAAATPLIAATPNAGQFHVADRWNIGGKGGWGFLAVDPAARRLYIPRTDHISVLDTSTGKIVGEIQGMSNLRNLALDTSGKFGYATDVTDGSAGFVRVFERTSIQLVASIQTSPIPFAIVFDPVTRFVLAFSSRDHNVAVIDTSTNQVVSTIPLAGRPGSATGDGKGAIFVTLPAEGMLQRIDAFSRKLTASWPLESCTGPAGLTLDVQDRQLLTACEDHKLVSVDAVSGEVNTIGDAPENVGDLDFDPPVQYALSG